MAAYVESNKFTLEETLVKYDKLTKHMLKTEAGSHTRHTLDTLWELQFEEIKHSPAADMLGLMSILGAEAVPIQLFLNYTRSSKSNSVFDFLEDEEECVLKCPWLEISLTQAESKTP